MSAPTTARRRVARRPAGPPVPLPTSHVTALAPADHAPAAHLLRDPAARPATALTSTVRRAPNRHEAPAQDLAAPAARPAAAPPEQGRPDAAVTAEHRVVLVPWERLIGADPLDEPVAPTAPPVRWHRTDSRPPAAPDLPRRDRGGRTRRSAAGARGALTLPPGYFPALDGLRAVAILAVMVYHSGLFGRGLFFGVDTFFALSGFLLTASGLREWHRSGRIHLGRHYWRRFKRLIPGTVLVLGLAGWAVLELGSAAQVDRFREQALASLAFVTNWEQILAGASYWDGYATLNPLGHMWSLAVIEQFSLLWPLVVAAVLAVVVRRGRRHRDHVSLSRIWVLAAVAAAGLAAAALRPLLTFDGSNADRMYLGTDTHAQGFFAGALVGIGMHLWALRRARRTAQGIRPRGAGLGLTVLATLCSVALTGVLVALVLRTEAYTDPWLYRRCGFTLVAVVAAALAVTFTTRASLLGRLLAWTPFVEVGKVSYSLFLVHMPVYWLILALAPQYEPRDVLIVGLPASLLVAGGLHHLIAEPLRLRPWRPRLSVGFALVSAAVVAGVWFTPAAWTALHSGNGDLQVLTLGDSVANDFASALGANSGSVVTVTDAGLPGCGISGAVQVRTAAGITQPAPDGCNPWESRYRRAITDAAPDVIVLDLEWDAVSSDLGDGVWTDLTDPDTAAAYRGQLDRLAELTDDTGAPVLIATMRSFTAVNTPEQAQAFNTILAEAVAAHPQWHLLDLAGQVCDEQECSPTTATGAARYVDDRVHFSREGKQELAPWLTEQIEAALRPTPQG